MRLGQLRQRLGVFIRRRVVPFGQRRNFLLQRRLQLFDRPFVSNRECFLRLRGCPQTCVVRQCLYDESKPATMIAIHESLADSNHRLQLERLRLPEFKFSYACLRSERRLMLSFSSA